MYYRQIGCNRHSGALSLLAANRARDGISSILSSLLIVSDADPLIRRVFLSKRVSRRRAADLSAREKQSDRRARSIVY